MDLIQRIADRVSNVLYKNKNKKTNTSTRKFGDRPKANKGLGTKKNIKPAVAPSLILLKKDDLPLYSEVLSLKNGIINLSKEQQADIIVLRDLHKPDLAHIIVSKERKTSSAVDVTSLDITQKLKSHKILKTITHTSERSLIQLVYSELDESSLIDNEEKEGLELAITELLKKAKSAGVSDVHIEARSGVGAKVRWRNNGMMEDVQDWTFDYASRFCHVLYGVVAEEKDIVFNPDKNQSAKVKRSFTSDDNSEMVHLECRLQVMPASPKGFDVVLRLLPTDVASAKSVSLEALGYNDKHVADINLAMARPTGVIIIAGTTGSGKSTSLSNMLSGKIESHFGALKVITVEDPVEVAIPGATQSPVIRTKTSVDKNPFVDSVRSSLRADPDIIMVGEIRDEDTSELLTHVVQSGHQVLTTLHSPSAIGIVPRLHSLKVGRDILGSEDFLSALVYQKLVPTLCEKCAIPIQQYSSSGKKGIAFEALKQRIGNVLSVENSKIHIRNHKGCDNCKKGVSGRTVLAEVIVPDEKMKELFFEGRDSEALRYWKSIGGKPIICHGIDKVVKALVCPFDMEHAVGLFDSFKPLLAKETRRVEENEEQVVVVDSDIDKVLKLAPEKEINEADVISLGPKTSRSKKGEP